MWETSSAGSEQNRRQKNRVLRWLRGNAGFIHSGNWNRFTSMADGCHNHSHGARQSTSQLVSLFCVAGKTGS